MPQADRDRGRGLPAGIRASGVLVAVAIGVTVPEKAVTYAVFPLRVIAIAEGPAPTLTGRPAVFVAVAMGITESRLRT